MTPAGVEVLKSCEGCELSGYPDPDSPLGKACRKRGLPMRDYKLVAGWESLSPSPVTAGYGVTGPGITLNTRWTQAQADAALMVRIKQTETALTHALPWFSKLEAEHPVRADCLVNIAFNIGVHGLTQWPITLKAVEQNRFSDASAYILGNRVWRNQVGARAATVAHAMLTEAWA